MKRLYELLCAVALLIVLTACGSEKTAYFQGLYLYMDGEKYVETGGLYEESDIAIAETEDDFTIYEVEGDSEHNYIVARSIFDATLYVREAYEKDRTTIEAVCLNQSTSKYVYNEDFIAAFNEELAECTEKLEIDDDTLASCRKDEVGVYLKYEGDSVGGYCGSIISDGTDYMYYNAETGNVVPISEKMQNLLAEVL